MGGLHPGGIISRIIYLLADGWAYIWGGGLKLGGNKVRFYDILMNRTEKISFFPTPVSVSYTYFLYHRYHSSSDQFFIQN